MKWTKLSQLPNKSLTCGPYKITYWAIKNNKVWHQDRMLRSADPDSFEVRIKEDSEPVTEYPIHEFFGRDKNNVYHAWNKIKSIDRNSFEFIGSQYWKDKHLVYCEYETSLKPLKGNDVENFINLDGYARDSQFAYYFGKPLKACKDPMSFRLIAENNPVYAADSGTVFYDGGSLKGSDPKTWKLLTDDGFSGDAKGVYYGSRKLPRVDLESWEKVSNSYSKDKRSVFHMNRKLKDADPQTWELFGWMFSKDDKSMYCGDTKFEDFDMELFLNSTDQQAKELLVSHTEILYRRSLAPRELNAVNALFIA